MFCLESGEAVATDRLMDMKLISNKTNTSYSDNLLLKTYLISNVKKGFWIAGMTCDGSMGFYLCADRLRSMFTYFSFTLLFIDAVHYPL